MRQEENERYEQWLQQVRKTQPILTRPDDLTQDILQKVARTPGKERSTENSWLGLRPWLPVSCFALWLMRLFLFRLFQCGHTGCRVKCFSFVPPFIRMAGRPERRHEPKGKECLSVRNVESTEG